MTSEQLVTTVIDGLHDLQISYMLAGSFSVSFYGIPRSTQDADFVVQLQGNELTELLQHLGPTFRCDGQLSFETVTMTTRYIVHRMDHPFKFEFFLLSNDPHDQSRFNRRCIVTTLNRQVWLPSAEDVIVVKLRWSKLGKRTKDMDDARNVIAVQKGAIDWNYVRYWCGQHGTLNLLDQILDSLAGIGIL